MSNIPIGIIKDQNTADSTSEPYCYAEVNFDGGYLRYEAEEYPSDREGFILIYKLGSEFVKSEIIDREQAIKILEKKDMVWDYVK